jgi:hypothetical protein
LHGSRIGQAGGEGKGLNRAVLKFDGITGTGPPTADCESTSAGFPTAAVALPLTLTTPPPVVVLFACA